MFVSGASVRNVLGKENRKPTAWLVGLGTPLPFLVALFVVPFLPLDQFMGSAESGPALVLVFAIATAVTSIPVITKIFYDLGILHTRFASLTLGVAVLEDILLWGVLAIATAIASASVAAGGGTVAGAVTVHLVVNVLFVVLAVTVLPAVLRRLSRARWNIVATQSPIAWIVVVFLAYVSAAAALDVTLAFAAFLAGFGIVGGTRNSEEQRFRPAIEAVTHVSTAVFIPIYFAMVGYRLDFTQGFSPLMLVGFLVGSTVIVLRVEGPGRAAGRVPRTRHREPGADLQCTRGTGHRAGERCLRRRHHQCPLLHRPGAHGGADLPGRAGPGWTSSCDGDGRC